MACSLLEQKYNIIDCSTSTSTSQRAATTTTTRGGGVITTTTLLLLMPVKVLVAATVTETKAQVVRGEVSGRGTGICNYSYLMHLIGNNRLPHHGTYVMREYQYPPRCPIVCTCNWASFQFKSWANYLVGSRWWCDRLTHTQTLAHPHTWPHSMQW